MQKDLEFFVALMHKIICFMASFQSKLIHVSLLMLTGLGNSLNAEHSQNLFIYIAASFNHKQKQKLKKKN